MAKEHGALLLALEHRFYGDSINADGLKTENLADLSSKQALVSAPCVRVCVCVVPHFTSSTCIFHLICSSLQALSLARTFVTHVLLKVAVCS